MQRENFGESLIYENFHVIPWKQYFVNFYVTRRIRQSNSFEPPSSRTGTVPYIHRVSDVISMLAGFRRHLVGNTLIFFSPWYHWNTLCWQASDHTDIFINQRIECYWNNTINLRPLNSTHYAMLCPQNGDRIVAIDSVTHFTQCVRQWCTGNTYSQVTARAFQFGQKKFRFDSIRQSDKFAACTLTFK